MAKLLDTLIKIMGGHYTELVENQNFVKEQLTLEEDRFFKTIDLGMSIFTQEVEKIMGNGLAANAVKESFFNGEVAFKLYDTYGFPLDLTEDMLRDKNLKVDTIKFDELMNAQKAMAKAAWKGSGDASNDGDFKQLIEKYGINEFVGYNNVTYKSKILALLDENFKEVSTLEKILLVGLCLTKLHFTQQVVDKVEMLEH